MLWNDWRRRYALRILAVFCFPFTVFAQATRRSWSPTNMSVRASTSAQPIFELSLLVSLITAAVFAVALALVHSVVMKFRKRLKEDGRKPAQVYGSDQAGLAFTLIPILIIVILFWQQRE